MDAMSTADLGMTLEGRWWSGKWYSPHHQCVVVVLEGGGFDHAGKPTRVLGTAVIPPIPQMLTFGTWGGYDIADSH